MKKELIEWIRAIGFAIIVVFFIQFFVKPTTVFNVSMNPTLVERDVLILQVRGALENGDIVAFKSNQGFSDAAKARLPFYKKFLINDQSRMQFIKRIIAKPGDRIGIKDGLVFVNDQLIEEKYIQGVTQPDLETFVVPDESYFVMGDNREHSSDSREDSIGLVSKDVIVGKVLLRVWPLNKLGAID